jgi:putative oxidoreductase
METLCKLATTWGVLLGRVFLAAIFLQSGVDKVLHYEPTLKAMTSRGMPLPELLIVPAIVLLLAGSISLLLGWKARWGALALIVFTIPATLYFHNFWDYPQAQYVNQLHHFFKNLAIVGGLLVVLGLGSGPMSLERHPQG